MDDVARVHLAQPHAPGNRRRDARIGELQARAVHLAAIRLDHALVLAHQRFLRIHLLPGDGVLREQGAIAREVELGVLEERRVLQKLTLGLGELHLERARVYFGQQVAVLHQLAFLEAKAHQLAIHAAFHRDDVAWRDVAKTFHIDGDVALSCRGGGDGRRGGLRSAPVVHAGFSGRGLARGEEGDACRERQHHQGRDEDFFAPAKPRVAGRRAFWRRGCVHKESEAVAVAGHGEMG
jgi:hypothetical protein